MDINHIPIPAGQQTIEVEGTPVLATVTRQHGQYYAVGEDVKGVERAGIGESVEAACDNLKGVLTTVKHHHEQHP